MPIGKLVVIEGSDCSGKGTQAEILIERLKKESIPCETMTFPRYNTPSGRVIGQCYLGKEDLGERLGWEGNYSWFGEANLVDPLVASLYYAADRRAAVQTILKILSSGKHLILDRYVESNLAHQGGKIQNPGERKLFIHRILGLEYGVLNLPRPDKVIFLHMPYEVSMELKKSRPGKADGHESSLEHLKNAETVYMELFEMLKWAKVECAPDRTIKSLRTKEEIAEEVYRIMKFLL